MKHLMREQGVDAIAIPNGLAPDAFDAPDEEGVRELQRRFRDRTVLVKMARFDPDKRWLLAVETVAPRSNPACEGKETTAGNHPLQGYAALFDIIYLIGRYGVGPRCKCPVSPS
jgi:hypothetical protein